LENFSILLKKYCAENQMFEKYFGKLLRLLIILLFAVLCMKNIMRNIAVRFLKKIKNAKTL